MHAVLFVPPSRPYLVRLRRTLLLVLLFTTLAPNPCAAAATNFLRCHFHQVTCMQTTFHQIFGNRSDDNWTILDSTTQNNYT